MKSFYQFIFCLVVLAFTCFSEAKAANGNVLYMVGNSNQLNAADQLIDEKLASMNLDVVKITAAETNVENMNSIDLIIISSTILSSELTASLSSLSVPIITWEGGIYNALKMCSTGAWGISTMSNDIATIINNSHSIANEIPATASIVTSAPQVYTIIKKDSLPSGAIPIATIKDDLGEEQTVIFCYETGAFLVDGSSASARRIGLFMHDNTATELTELGWKLFENAVMWALYGKATKVTERTTAPQTSGLLPNYPNPFNPETTIRFKVLKQTNIRLDIFDVAGKHVTTLHHGSISAGIHETIWRGTDERGQAVPSGVYFVRMRWENRSYNGKILLAS